MHQDATIDPVQYSRSQRYLSHDAYIMLTSEAYLNKQKQSSAKSLHPAVLFSDRIFFSL